MSDADTTQEVTDEEVRASRDRVNQLREELAQTNARLVQTEQNRNSAVQKARLDREAESLERQLETARRRLEVSQQESSLVEAVEDGEGQTSFISGREEANVVPETGEVNPEEVERLTSHDASDEDEDKE